MYYVVHILVYSLCSLLVNLFRGADIAVGSAQRFGGRFMLIT
jgi:glycine cleavage system pyridoxal-binding protein P